MQVTAKFQSLIEALLPTVEYSMRFTSSYERLISIEQTGIGRIELFSKNSGNPLQPIWSEPRCKILVSQSLDGMNLEEVKKLNDFVFAAEKVLGLWLRLSESELGR